MRFFSLNGSLAGTLQLHNHASEWLASKGRKRSKNCNQHVSPNYWSFIKNESNRFQHKFPKKFYASMLSESMRGIRVLGDAPDKISC
uniref:Uncharacterized protein n=1 Tax=Lactuca sativa TaxID=4236 RepID=A0A9R1UCE1_LACSA|nr:hypothetical protein LSAT_V11C900504960 [Lactuca sativa]